jgi:uncharacterized metal-binding protein
MADPRKVRKRMKPSKPECATCGVKVKICRSPEGKAPAFCPAVMDPSAFARANEEYSAQGIHEFARQASIQEAECYVGRDEKPYVLHPVKTRVQETCEFAHKMGYKRLGVAFCSGLQEEARVLVEILEVQGFDVVSVVCKAGATPKEFIGIAEEQKIRIGEFESMCSPIAQATVLNDYSTDLNILLGLCVGHDSLFLKYAKSPCTVLVVKDRVLGHAPAAALHTSHSYYAWLKKPRF